MLSQTTGSHHNKRSQKTNVQDELLGVRASVDGISIRRYLEQEMKEDNMPDTKVLRIPNHPFSKFHKFAFHRFNIESSKFYAIVIKTNNGVQDYLSMYVVLETVFVKHGWDWHFHLDVTFKVIHPTDSSQNVVKVVNGNSLHSQRKWVGVTSMIPMASLAPDSQFVLNDQLIFELRVKHYPVHYFRIFSFVNPEILGNFNQLIKTIPVDEVEKLVDLNRMEDKNRFLFKSPFRSDCTLLFSQNDRIPVHQHVLSIASPFFRQILDDPSRIKTRNSKGHTLVSFVEFDKEMTMYLLLYIYTQEIYWPSSRVDKINLLKLAKKFQLQDYINAVCSKIEPTNSVEMLKVAHEAQCQAMREECLRVIDKTAELVLGADENLDIDINILNEIISRDTLCTEEDKVFDFVRRWANKQYSYRSQYLTPEESQAEVKEALSDTISLIRFPLISPVTFLTHLTAFKPFLVPEDENEIMKHMLAKNYQLPLPAENPRFCSTPRCKRSEELVLKGVLDAERTARHQQQLQQQLLNKQRQALNLRRPSNVSQVSTNNLSPSAAPSATSVAYTPCPMISTLQTQIPQICIPDHPYPVSIDDVIEMTPRNASHTVTRTNTIPTSNQQIIASRIVQLNHVQEQQPHRQQQITQPPPYQQVHLQPHQPQQLQTQYHPQQQNIRPMLQNHQQYVPNQQQSHQSQYNVQRTQTNYPRQH